MPDSTIASYTITRVITNAPFKPVGQITDRAKRYRAQSNVPGPKRCVMCNRTAKQVGGRGLDVMHLSGDESDGERKNLAYGCRSCNGKLAAAFKRIGAGVKTRQYNPSSGVPTFEQYKWAVSHGARHYWVKGQGWQAGEKDEYGAIIHATPRSKRVEYARRIAEESGHVARRRQRRMRRSPRSRDSEVPF